MLSRSSDAVYQDYKIETSVVQLTHASFLSDGLFRLGLQKAHYRSLGPVNLVAGVAA
jgi:hypothetical protein